MPRLGPVTYAIIANCELVTVAVVGPTVLDEIDKITLFSAQNMTDGALRAVALPIIDIKNSSAFWH
jgi:hypothetical protein